MHITNEAFHLHLADERQHLFQKPARSQHLDVKNSNVL